MKSILIIAFVLLALGYAGRIDKQTAELEQASINCQGVAYDTSIFDQCINNQLERNNDK